MQLKITAYVIKYDSLLIKFKKIKALWAFNHCIQYFSLKTNQFKIKAKMLSYTIWGKLLLSLHTY